ncbi:MAG TPA: LamG-like jellyroll fold domain-containing protein [Baekduia sp.]|nr:LamG-like jellyroll fold domain-containing protein [Baekduia sp.]
MPSATATSRRSEAVPERLAGAPARRRLAAWGVALGAVLGVVLGPAATASLAGTAHPAAAFGFAAGQRAADSASGVPQGARAHRVRWTGAGHRGGALVLRRGAWASLAVSKRLRVARGVTLEAWVRPARRTSGALLAGAARRGSPFGIALRHGVPEAYVASRHGRRLIARAHRALPRRHWSFVALRVSRRRIALHVGARRAAARPMTRRARRARSATRVLLGRRPGGRARLAASVDDVRVYARAIRAKRLAADRRDGVRALTGDGGGAPGSGSGAGGDSGSGGDTGGTGGTGTGAGGGTGGGTGTGGNPADATPDLTLPPQPTEANLWVDGDGGSCTRSSAAGGYVDAAACGSLGQAFQSAAPGDVVLVRGGSYGAQTIPVRSAMSSASADVIFEIAPGEVATFTGDIAILGSHVVLRGRTGPYNLRMAADTKLKVDHWTTPTSGADRTHDVRVDNVDGANFQIGPVAANVLIHGGDWGPSTSCSGGDENVISGANGQTPNGITLDGVLIHDQNTTSAASCHTGGLLIQGATNLAIRNARFWKNTIYDVMFDDFTGGFGTSHITIEDNWFAPPVQPLPDDTTADPAAADVQVKWNGVAAEDWLVRFNSFGNGMDAAWNGDPPSWSNYRFIGNTGGSIWDGSAYNACRGAGQPGVTIAYNAFVAIDNLGSSGSRGPTCGGNGNVSLGKVGDYGDLSQHPYASSSVTSPDFHLRAGTAAQDHVPTGAADSGLGRDIDGDARPAGGARDAGADERG